MGRKNQKGDKKPRTKAKRKKYERPGGGHMHFILGFGYQLTSIILVGLAFLAVAYFLTEKNGRGVIWSLFAVWCLTGLLAAIYAHQNYFPPVKQESDAEIKRQIQEFFASLKLPDSQITKKSPGLSLHVVLKTHRIAETRRKYLFDFGNMTKNRASFYFDSQDVFNFAIIDANGEPYSLRLSATDTPFEQFFYLACEVAIGEHSTQLRVLINGNQVGTLDLPFSVQLDVTGKTGVMGADLDGKNAAKFDSVETMLYSITLTTLEIQGLVQYFSSQPRTKYMQFGGTQWMRSGDNGFYQDLPEAKPRFRNLEEAKPN